MSRGVPRTKVVSTRFTADEHDELTQLAERLGIDLSELIRRGALGLTYPPPPVPSQTMHTVSAPLVRVDWRTSATTGHELCGWCAAEGYACPIHAEEGS